MGGPYRACSYRAMLTPTHPSGQCADRRIIHTKDYSLPAGTPISVIFSGGGLTSVMSNSVVVDASRLRWTSSVPPMVSMGWIGGLAYSQDSSVREITGRGVFGAQFSRNTVTASDTFKDQVGAAVSS